MQPMPRVLFALLVIVVASALAPAAATARDYPFCIKGCDFGAGLGDCSFSSYAQCQATAAGRDAYCGANPYFNANAGLAPNRGRQSKRQF